MPGTERLGTFFLVTCEHGGNDIPLPYRHLFEAAPTRALLDSHRGFDPGALTMAEELAKRLAAPLVISTVSRLLIDLNRSLGNPRLYSQATRAAPAVVREKIVETYYRPYRNQAENLIRQAVSEGGRVVHISCHSFTPELNGEVRNADIGMLYDPARAGEVALCDDWKASLKSCAADLKVRRNYPYAGKNDGFTTYFRRCFSADRYIGVELEINQKHVMQNGQPWAALRAALIESLLRALGLGAETMHQFPPPAFIFPQV